MHLSVQPSNPFTPSASLQMMNTNLLQTIASYLTIQEMNDLSRLTKIVARTLLGGHEKFFEACLQESSRCLCNSKKACLIKKEHQKHYLSLFVFSPYSAAPFIFRVLRSRNSPENPLTENEYRIWQKQASKFVVNIKHHEDVRNAPEIRMRTVGAICNYFLSKIVHLNFKPN